MSHYKVAGGIAARVAERMKKAQVTGDIGDDEKIINVNQTNFGQMIQDWMSVGATTGFILPNTGSNVIVVASSPEELKELIGHWTSYNYGGNFDPELYFWEPYVAKGEVEDIPPEQDFTDTEWDFMFNKAIEGAQQVELTSFM